MSAVIYAAIVVMWAVVLVPMWLHRRDEATESRSVDRFSTAMRTLSRRTSATPGRRYVVMPRRGDAHAPSVHVSGAPAHRRSMPSMSAVRSAASGLRLSRRNGRVSIVARRRRMLMLLGGASFLTLVLASAGATPWWLQITIDVLFVSFCAHLRVQARRAAAVSRQRRRATVATSPARASAPAQAAQPVRVSRPAAAAPASSMSYAAAAYQQSAAFAEAATDELELPETWEPVPVPPPTYTMKPPAPAFEADPTYSPPVYQPRADGDPGEDDRESDLDEILERRWAVND